MKKRFFLPFFVLICFSGSSVAQSSPITVADTDTMVMDSKLDEAYTALSEMLKEDKKNYEVLWRLARLEVLLGEREGDPEDEKSRYEEALDYANRAIKANKRGTSGYVRRAAANGKLALYEGVLTANTYVNAVLEDCETAINYNSESKDALATAYYILGRTHLKLSETPMVLRMPLDLDWGNMDEALEYLEEATKLRPGFIIYELDYARALIEDDEEKKAKEILSGIKDMEEQEPGDAERKEEAEELLTSL